MVFPIRPSDDHLDRHQQRPRRLLAGGTSRTALGNRPPAASAAGSSRDPSRGAGVGPHGGTETPPCWSTRVEAPPGAAVVFGPLIGNAHKAQPRCGPASRAGGPRRSPGSRRHRRLGRGQRAGRPATRARLERAGRVQRPRRPQRGRRRRGRRDRHHRQDTLLREVPGHRPRRRGGRTPGDDRAAAPGMAGAPPLAASCGAPGPAPTRPATPAPPPAAVLREAPEPAVSPPAAPRLPGTVVSVGGAPEGVAITDAGTVAVNVRSHNRPGGGLLIFPLARPAEVTTNKVVELGGSDRLDTSPWPERTDQPWSPTSPTTCSCAWGCPMARYSVPRMLDASPTRRSPSTPTPTLYSTSWPTSSTLCATIRSFGSCPPRSNPVAGPSRPITNTSSRSASGAAHHRVHPRG